MKRFFSRLVGLFAHNWGLKLLALTLAIVIYHALKLNNSTKRLTAETQNDRSIFQSR